jgi:hypothetical protein
MPAWTRLPFACAALLVLVACGRADERSRDGVGAFDDLPPGWTSLPEPPEVRSRAAMAWTGAELLVWSGYVFTGSGHKPRKSDGFVFDARAHSWKQMSPSPLAPRAHPASAWTGEELLIWGGSDERQGARRLFDDGAAYEPATDSWRMLPDAPIRARAPLSVWTGRQLLVWGTALRVDPRPRDGAAYDPRADAWQPIAAAPIELTDATALWTGDAMIVFGAALHGGNFPETKTAIAAAYDPETDRWRQLPDSDLSPQASTAAWAAREIVVWDYLNGTAALDPREDRWRPLDDVPIRSGECGPNSVAIGSTILGDYCGTLVRFDVRTDRWTELEENPAPGRSFELVAADPVFLVLGRDIESGEQRMLAYRPEP